MKTPIHLDEIRERLLPILHAVMSDKGTPAQPHDHANRISVRFVTVSPWDIAAMLAGVEHMEEERDEARAEVDRLTAERDEARVGCTHWGMAHAKSEAEVRRLNLLRTIDRAEITRFNLARRPTNTVESLILIATDPAMSLGVQDTARECLQLCGFPLDHLNAAGALLRSMETPR